MSSGVKVLGQATSGVVRVEPGTAFFTSRNYLWLVIGGTDDQRWSCSGLRWLCLCSDGELDWFTDADIVYYSINLPGRFPSWPPARAAVNEGDLG